MDRRPSGIPVGWGLMRRSGTWRAGTRSPPRRRSDIVAGAGAHRRYALVARGRNFRALHKLDVAVARGSYFGRLDQFEIAMTCRSDFIDFDDLHEVCFSFQQPASPQARLETSIVLTKF